LVLRGKEKLVLDALAFKGEMNISKLSSATTLNVTTTRRVLKRLRGLDLVCITNEKTGLRGKLMHSLTPKGIVLVFNDIEYDKIPYLIANYESYTPTYIKFYRQFEEKGLLEEVRKILTENNLPSIDDSETKKDNHYTTYQSLLIIKKHIIDTIFIKKVIDDVLYIKKEYKLMLIELIKKDQDFKEVWRRWINIQNLILTGIKEISKEANIN